MRTDPHADAPKTCRGLHVGHRTTRHLLATGSVASARASALLVSMLSGTLVVPAPWRYDGPRGCMPLRRRVPRSGPAIRFRFRAGPRRRYRLCDDATPWDWDLLARRRQASCGCGSCGRSPKRSLDSRRRTGESSRPALGSPPVGTSSSRIESGLPVIDLHQHGLARTSIA